MKAIRLIMPSSMTSSKSTLLKESFGIAGTIRECRDILEGAYVEPIVDNEALKLSAYKGFRNAEATDILRGLALWSIEANVWIGRFQWISSEENHWPDKISRLPQASRRLYQMRGNDMETPREWFKQWYHTADPRPNMDAFFLQEQRVAATPVYFLEGKQLLRYGAHRDRHTLGIPPCKSGVRCGRRVDGLALASYVSGLQREGVGAAVGVETEARGLLRSERAFMDRSTN